MSFVPQEIEDYCIYNSTQSSQVARELMNFTRASVHGSNMLIGEMEGSVLKFLIKLGKVKTIIELGTYTGYSALIMAEALPDDGKVITIDLNPETSKIAQSFWDKSEHGKKITLMLKPGLEALAELKGEFDFFFIDADKNNYPHYLDWALKHLSPTGVIVTDNTLWSGKVLTAGVDKQTDSIREHNEKARLLQGYTKTLLPIRDGMYLIQRS
ncbi:MAG: class I SAM-dependent methyltransferase [Bdellovibrionales bacterium]|nr:class I SAM-dependent methyltransferase [Bdellovibrionales bacterium]